MMASNLTKEAAIKIAKSEIWKEWSFVERAKFQMLEERLCMPFGIFHEAVEKTLNRPVFTHEFALNRDGILDEMFDGKAPPSLKQIIEMIPEEKRIVLCIDK
jgi:hypothetical protein